MGKRILSTTLGYKEPIGQKWVNNSYSKTYSDQFGFVIHYSDRIYHLKYKGEPITTLYSVEAAKLISTIILNDIVVNKQIK